jgi:hypothetical protein
MPNAALLVNVGSELHERKAEAYGMTPEDRAQIPESIKQPSAIWTDSVTGAQQVGFGVMDHGIPFGDDAYILASLDEAAVAICDEIHRLIADISENQLPCCLFDGLLLLHVPCGLLSGSNFPEADELLLRQD